MICKNCGEELPVGAEICPKCGTRVERKKLTPEDEARIKAAIPALREALMLNKITSDTTLSDEERIKAAVPVLREALRRNFQQGWRCKVCGHNNPRSAVSCVKCGRDRIRTEKLTPGEYDPANMPKPEPQEEIVRYVKAEEPKEEPKKEEPKPAPAPTPIVYNYVYGPGGGMYGAQYSQETVVSGNTIGTPYVSSRSYSSAQEKHDKAINRVLAAIMLILSGALLAFVTFFEIMTFKDAGLTKSFTVGYQLVMAAIYAISGGTIAGAGKAGGIQYCWTDAWMHNFTVNGYINWGRIIYVTSTVLLLVVALFGLIMFIMNIVRLATGKMKRGCHGTALATLIIAIVLAITIIVGGTFLDPTKYTAGCGAVQGLMIGAGVVLAIVAALTLFILGFFAKRVYMVTSKSSDKDDNNYNNNNNGGQLREVKTTTKTVTYKGGYASDDTLAE